LRASPWNTIPHRTCTFSGGKYLWGAPLVCFTLQRCGKKQSPAKSCRIVLQPCINVLQKCQKKEAIYCSLSQKKVVLLLLN